jgi:hypothetical protein
VPHVSSTVAKLVLGRLPLATHASLPSDQLMPSL